MGGEAGAFWTGGCLVVSPGGTGAIVRQYPGMAFMEDQDDGVSPLGNGGVRLEEKKIPNIPNSITFWQEIKA